MSNPPAMAPRSLRRSWISAHGEPSAEAAVTWSGGSPASPRVELSGVLCTLTVLRMGHLLLDVVQGALAPVVVDLHRVTFIDGRGVGLLLTARRTMQTRGLDMELQRPSAVVCRLFDILGESAALSAPHVLD